jgi:ABC-type uncharacterized transport system substrate-binding protein
MRCYRAGKIVQRALFLPNLGLVEGGGATQGSHRVTLNTYHRLLRGMAAAFVILGAAMPAAAHPHMCVGAEATVLYEKGAFTGLKQKWTFTDERYIAEAVEGLDTNKDGKLDRAELDALAKINVEGLKEFDYFTIATVADQPVKLGEAFDYWLEHTEGALHLYFTLRFATAVPVGDKSLELGVRDTSYFIAFGLPKVADSIRLATGTPARCRVAVELPEAEEQTTTKQILEALGCAITMPKAIKVVCDGP